MLAGTCALLPKHVLQPFQMASLDIGHLQPSFDGPAPGARSTYAFPRRPERRQEVSKDSEVAKMKMMKMKQTNQVRQRVDPSLSGLLAFGCVCKVRCQRINSTARAAVAKDKKESINQGQWRLWMACVAALPGSFQYGFGLSALALTPTTSLLISP